MANSKKGAAKVQKLPQNKSIGKPQVAPGSAYKGLSAAQVAEALPMTSYISVVAVHSTLWIFTTLYLPRTTFLSELTTPEWDSVQLSSKDRPQHPFMVALTMNPTVTLACICAGAVVLQGWWAGWMRNWWLELGIRASGDERRTEKAFHDCQKLTMVRNAWLATFTASFMIHVALVLFGAPIASHVLKTYLLALLVSIMTVYTPAYVIGAPTLGNKSLSVVKRWTWVRLFAEFSARNPVERALVYPVCGTLFGCWLGVIPIALDWDRPWQAWPLTPAFGAIAGYIVSSMLALTIHTVVQLAEENIQAQLEVKDSKMS
ncbi:unnamed protein product [Cyclocybe aegerita]|uniref:Phosphatidylinositol-glycan biosynthesis class F protein n=1 Tax=Cyclocybe aegerita TaxID=1973307 RepID=A0A8S0X0B3_CYCAE|nr:unnamed protein product [Cyclocybe aegerita]